MKTNMTVRCTLAVPQEYAPFLTQEVERGAGSAALRYLMTSSRETWGVGVQSGGVVVDVDLYVPFTDGEALLYARPSDRGGVLRGLARRDELVFVRGASNTSGYGVCSVVTDLDAETVTSAVIGARRAWRVIAPGTGKHRSGELWITELGKEHLAAA